MSKTSKDEVPLTKDGHPDRRTVAGREAAAAEGEASPRKGKDGVPLNKDGTPDRRTVEGREAAEGESSPRREADTKTRLDGEVDKRTVEGRQQVHSEQGKDSDKSSSSSSGSSDHQFEEGDAVVFNIGSNNLHGTISRVLTKDAEVDGRIAHGSKDEPRYAVKYEGTGVEQIRTEGALKKDESQSSSGSSSSSDKSSSSNSSNSSNSGRKDDRYRKGHKFEEGETVVFHIGKQTLHGKIAKVSERTGEYKVSVGSDTLSASEKDLEKDKSSSSSSKGDNHSSSKGDHHKFNEGDSVTFNIGLNNLHGTITRVITEDDEVDGRIAHGSKDEPRYAVQYEGTGVEQIRTEGALKKDEDSKMDEDKNNKRKREEESKDKDNNRSSSKEPSPKKSRK